MKLPNYRLLPSLYRYFSNNIQVNSKFLMSNVVRLNRHAIEFQLHIRKAAEELLDGKVIALPTDTIYGLAAHAQDNDAIARIYEIKRRNIKKPIAICVSDIEDIYDWGKVTVPRALLEELLPGPVTVVFERTPELNQTLNPGTNLVGIRIPDDDFVCGIARHCGAPLALTSANIADDVSPLNISEFRLLWDSLHAVYDIGALSDSHLSRAGSTIIDLSEKGFYRVIRKGSALSSTKTVLHKYHLKHIE